MIITSETYHQYKELCDWYKRDRLKYEKPLAILEQALFDYERIKKDTGIPPVDRITL